MSFFIDLCVSSSNINHAILFENALEAHKLAGDYACFIAENAPGGIFGGGNRNYL